MKPVLLASLLICSSLVIACGETSAPARQQLNGSFALTSVNGWALPDTEAIAPRAGPVELIPSGPLCAILGTSGVLTLDSAAKQFTISMNARNSCASREWLFLTESGTYSQVGTTLMMIEPFPDHVANLTGQVGARTITVHGVFHDYTFER